MRNYRVNDEELGGISDNFDNENIGDFKYKMDQKMNGLKVIGSFYSMNNLNKDRIKINSEHQFEKFHHLRNNGVTNVNNFFNKNPIEGEFSPIYIKNEKRKNASVDHSQNLNKNFNIEDFNTKNLSLLKGSPSLKRSNGF